MGRRDGGLHRCQAGHVHRHRVCPALGGEGGTGRFQQGRVLIPQGHGGARIEQPLGDGIADTLRTAGHDRAAAIQINPIQAQSSLAGDHSAAAPDATVHADRKAIATNFAHRLYH